MKTHIHFIIETKGEKQKMGTCIVEHGVHMSAILECMNRPLLREVREHVTIINSVSLGHLLRRAKNQDHEDFSHR